MPSRINKVPDGLLDLLDLKALGQNPSVFPDTVQPSIDLFPFYAAGDLRQYREQVNSAAAGSLVTLRIPTGEIWIPIHMSASHVVGSTNQNGTVGLSIRQIPASPESPETGDNFLWLNPAWGQQDNFTAGTPIGARMIYTYSWPFRIAYPSNVEFNWFVLYEDITVAVDYDLILAYYRFRV